MKAIKPILHAPPPPKESSPGLNQVSSEKGLFQEKRGRVSRIQIDRHITKTSLVGSKNKDKMKEIVAGLGDANKKSITRGEVKEGLKKMEENTINRTERSHIRKLRSSLL